MPVRETLYLDVSPALAQLKVLDAQAAKIGPTLGTGLAQATKKLNVGQIGSTLTRNVTLPIAAVGAASIFMASQFESSMQKIVGLAGGSQKSIEGLKQGVLELAGTTARSPQELAEALYFVSSAGFQGAEAMKILEISARAAASGLGETQVIADTLTSVISAYGRENITASRAADVLTASVKVGKAEATDLANGIGNLAPLASQLGVSFEDLGATIAALTVIGMDTDTAFTNVRQIMASLLKVTPQTADALASVGLNASQLRDTLAEPGGVLKVLRQINDAFGGNEEAMAAVFPNIRALSGAMGILAQNGAEVDKVFKAVRDSTGDSGKAFNVASKTSMFQFKQAMADLQVAAIKLGNTLLPVATKIVGVIGDIATAFGNLPDWAQNFILGGAAAAAALGPILKIAAGVTTLATNLGVSSTALGNFGSNLGKFALGAGAIGGALILGKLASDQFRTGALDPLSDAAATAEGAMRGLSQAILDQNAVLGESTRAWLQHNAFTSKGGEILLQVMAKQGLGIRDLESALAAGGNELAQFSLNVKAGADAMNLSEGDTFKLVTALDALGIGYSNAEKKAAAAKKVFAEPITVHTELAIQQLNAVIDLLGLTAQERFAIVTLVQQGATREQILALLNTLDLTKGERQAILRVLDFATAPADKAKGAVDRFPNGETRTSTVKVNDQASGPAWAGTNAFNSFPNGQVRTNTVRTVYEKVFHTIFGAKGGVVGQGRLGIPRMAQGGMSGGGAVIVGEKGPELVWLPNGARVITAAESKRALQGARRNPVVGTTSADGSGLVEAARALMAAAGALRASGASVTFPAKLGMGRTPR